MTPKIVDKAAKKQEILNAAMQVFAQKGVVKSKMADIAETAGIGKGTIYEYFKSKEDIFAEAFSSFFSGLETTIIDSLKSTSDPVEKLRILIDVSVNSILDAEEFAEIMMDFWAEGIRNKDTKLLEAVNLNNIYKEYRKIISAIIAEGIHKGVFRNLDSHALAAIFIAALDGIMLQWIMDRNLIDIHKVGNALLDSFLNGIKS